MKKIITLLLSICALCACSDENVLPGNEEKEETRTVTFNLKGIADRDFSVQTRAVDTTAIDFSKYAVKFFLFERMSDTDEYVLKHQQDVTQDFFTITGLDVKSYRYLFVAVSKGFEYMLDAKDSNAWKWNSTYPVSVSAKVGTALYKNCYFPFIENEDNNEIWEYVYDVAPCTLPNTNANLEIYGQGYILSSGMDFHVPIDILLERQYGSVEVRLKNLTQGETVSVAVTSEYYRIYLSQMVKSDINSNYTSENKGNINSGGSKTSDYASGTVGVPIRFQSSMTAASAEQVILLHLPYTTAEKTGNTVTNDKHKATGLSLTIGSNTYSYAAKFPIYRNGVSYFVRKGDQLAIEFTTQSDPTPGIDIEEDWNGY